MAFIAQVIRILIASPSDVGRERISAVEIIQRWNDANSFDRQVVLLPLRWETHGSAEYGQRPQAILNKQVVDYCDMVVGIFWTKLGTPTGIANSGTVEEISRAANDGKLVMLYFSGAPQAPDLIDIDQLAKLRNFKEEIKDKSLFFGFADAADFKDIFARQLDVQIKELLAKQQNSQTAAHVEVRGSTIDFQFADPVTGKPVGDEINVELKPLEVLDFSQIPDFDKSRKKDGLRPPTVVLELNKNYYRQKIVGMVLASVLAPVRFSLRNVGNIGARDIFVELNFSILSPSGDTDLAVKMILKPNSTISSSPPSQYGAGGLLYSWSPQATSVEEVLGNWGHGWVSSIDIPALQPQRVISPDSNLLISVTGDAQVVISAKIYADLLSEPVVKKLRIKFVVKPVEVSYQELILEDS